MLTNTDFENMGKAAASEYVGSNQPLNTTIVKIAEHYGLNPAQIARVVEKANIETYLKLNNAAEDKYTEFETANQIKIAATINFSKEKTAQINQDSEDIAADVEYHIISGLLDEDIERTKEGEVRYLTKLAKSILKSLGHKLEEIDDRFSRESDSLYKLVKQSALESGQFGLIKIAMVTAAPTPITELIIDTYEQKLKKEASRLDFTVVDDLEGTILNTEHPLIKGLVKLAVLKDEYVELKKLHTELEKEAILGAAPINFFRHLKGVGREGATWLGQTGLKLIKTLKEKPGLASTLLALGVGTQIGKARGRSETSKGNVKLRKEYVQHGTRIKPL